MKKTLYIYMARMHKWLSERYYYTARWLFDGRRSDKLVHFCTRRSVRHNMKSSHYSVLRYKYDHERAV